MTVGDVATVARGLALAEVQVAKKWQTQVLGARGVHGLPRQPADPVPWLPWWHLRLLW